MAAGGTGGHIFPALAVAQELRSRGDAVRAGRVVEGRLDLGTPEIFFLGTARGLEAKVIPASGFPLRTVKAAGLKGIRGRRFWQNLVALPQSAWMTAGLLRELRPSVVVGLGGYAAGPALLEAALARIPTVLVEPNAIPGFTNRALAPWVRVAAVGFDQAASYYGKKARVTGHPVRPAFFLSPPKQHIAPFTLLVLGGSQGSVAINQCLIQALPLLIQQAPDMRIVHQTGERSLDQIRQAYLPYGGAAEAAAFIDDVPAALASADLVVSRSGALTVAELSAAGKAAILIPFPAAADNHQLANARALEMAGGAVVIEQSVLTPEVLAGTVYELLKDSQRLERMEQSSRKLARPHAAAEIAGIVEELAHLS